MRLFLAALLCLPLSLAAHEAREPRVVQVRAYPVSMCHILIKSVGVSGAAFQSACIAGAAVVAEATEAVEGEIANGWRADYRIVGRGASLYVRKVGVEEAPAQLGARGEGGPTPRVAAWVMF